MNISIQRICITLSLFALFSFANGQEAKQDSTESKKERKNLRFSILGGPGYTPDFGALLGGSALFTFSTNASDKELKRSVVPIGFAFLFEGGVTLISRPQLFFNHDRFRIFGQVIYKYTLDNYYGVGYETNKDRPRGKETTGYRNNALQINPIFLFRFQESNFFIGPVLDITSDRMNDVSEGVAMDENYIAQGGTSEELYLFNTGLGLNLSYDTRDVPANAYSGLLFDFKLTHYATYFGGDMNYSNISLEYRQFTTLDWIGKRKSLGWMIQSKNSFGDVALSRIPFVGSPFDLRGYYLGQYRDESVHLAMGEYRNMFNSNRTDLMGKLINRLGFATWAGVGFMGPEPFDIEGVLPNFGAGLRIEVQPRMNFRIDVGHNPINKNTLVYFNMTEAF
ncbi:BamA/TamA family outer membrane protein [Carboxylicivirga sp. M1479]|uniref:BamA/TamA family outer membrane protein n=1 Tax=Carboxylicivirga sp. M1479 TaxID=2594476 RepID=UPI001178243E|nr:BamA/TamA family outer membrane protein [Carboxylicivirga sp. M1479]TRX72049.1 BamA/TamA family outer membrane protein [Carboxylicivirga sp. M1479]